MTSNPGPLARLADPMLLEEAIEAARLWAPAGQAEKYFEVTNPATGMVLARLPDVPATAARQAIARARDVQVDWARRSAKERSAGLKAWHRLWIEHADDLALILTAEQGKPLREARDEIMYGAAYLEWFAEEAKRIYGDVIPGHDADHRILVLRQPVGVVGAITPWNFPNAMIARKIAPALAVGCAVVAKPAAETPLSTLALAALAQRAGLPDGLFSVVTNTDGPAIGLEFTQNPDVAKITFTGSTAVGRTLMRQGADQIKKLSLELGGNAPFIVFADADLDKAVEGAMAAKFRNAGQTCVCANRIYVHDSLHDAFVEKFAERVNALKVGDGTDPQSDIGPLINQRSREKVDGLIRDALDHGAKLVTSRDPLAAEGQFMPPCILTGATRDMRLASEEIFGPVAPIFRFHTSEEVISQANASEYGLAAYFYAQNISEVMRVVEALEVGIVGVNTGRVSTEVAPFGGVKQSGLGREGARQGAEAYVELKYLALGL